MRAGWCVLAVLLAAVPHWAAAQDAARETGRRLDAEGRYTLPTGVFDGTSLPQRAIEGRRETIAWSQPVGPDVTPLSVFGRLAEELERGGARILFRCAAAECGGFDFRSRIEILPPPAMYLDLADFYAIGAETGRPDAAGLELVLVSRTASAVHWQATVLRPEGSRSGAEPPLPAIAALPEGTGDRAAMLDRDGAAVLADVGFASGTSELGPELPASLAALAAYLESRRDLRATIVGHSDSSGSAAGNMALSRRRAEAVRNLLVSRLGVAPERLEAAGAGALAPRASNATEEGRRENRRVEVVLRFD